MYDFFSPILEKQFIDEVAAAFDAFKELNEKPMPTDEEAKVSFKFSNKRQKKCVSLKENKVKMNKKKMCFLPPEFPSTDWLTVLKTSNGILN